MKQATMTIDEACKILDISKDISLDEFKKFKRSRLKFLHPDRQGNNKEEKDFFTREFTKNMEAIEVFESYNKNKIESNTYTHKTNNEYESYGEQSSYNTQGTQGSYTPPKKERFNGELTYNIKNDLQILQSCINKIIPISNTILTVEQQYVLLKIDKFLIDIAYIESEKIPNYSIYYCNRIRPIPKNIQYICSVLTSQGLTNASMLDAFSNAYYCAQYIVDQYTPSEHNAYEMNIIRKDIAKENREKKKEAEAERKCNEREKQEEEKIEKNKANYPNEILSTGLKISLLLIIPIIFNSDFKSWMIYTIIIFVITLGIDGILHLFNSKLISKKLSSIDLIHMIFREGITKKDKDEFPNNIIKHMNLYSKFPITTIIFRYILIYPICICIISLLSLVFGIIGCPIAFCICIIIYIICLLCLPFLLIKQLINIS